MRIKELDIYGYGKWVDQRFDLDKGLQIFLGQNEAGKSTLMSFIHSILFGFPTRNSTFLRYEPQESSKYGGRIIAEDRTFGEVIIERVHGKVTGDVTVTLEDGTTGSDELLDQLLKGLNRENFQSIYSFSLSDIENVHQLDKSKLSRYLLNIGAHSTDYYLNLVDEFQKQAYDLYRPSGRIPPLNKQLSGIANQEKKLEKLEQRNQSYLDLLKKQAEQDKLLEQIEQKKNSLQEKLSYLKEFKKELSVLREIQTLQQDIRKTNLPMLKKDGPYLLEEYKKEIHEAEAALSALARAIEEHEASFLKPELIGNYQVNKQEINALEQELPEMVEEIGRLEAVEQQLADLNQQVFERKQLLKIDLQDTESSSFTKTEELMVSDWLTSYDQLTSKVDLLTTELQEVEHQLNLKNQQADQYEELMWDDDYLKEIEQQLQVNEQPQQEVGKLGSRLIPTATGLLGLGTILAAFILPLANRWFLVGAGVIFLFISFISYREGTKKEVIEQPETQLSNNLLKTEYEKQRKIQADWQSLLGEIDAIQSSYQANMEEKSALVNKQHELIEKWRKLLISKSLPTVHLFEDAEIVLTQMAQLQELEGRQEQLTRSKDYLTGQLDQKMSVIDEVLSIDEELELTEKMQHFRLYLRELNQLLETEESKLIELNTMKEKEKQLVSVKETAAIKKDHLLATSGVEAEAAFLVLYEQKAALEQKKSRVQFLKENAPAFDADQPLPSKKELSNQEEKLSEQLREKERQAHELINERANIRVNIKHLEKDGSYSEALQEFENKKASTQNLVDEWISDKIAAAIIRSTLNKVTQERFEEIMSEMNRYFSLLTDEAYEGILFKEDELFVQKKDGSVIEVKALSRGTSEPLYVAIRLAYIVKMEDVIRLPIVIDDPFVNFDQQRKENVYRLLDELSDKLQIIYFSFDTDLRYEFSEYQIIELGK